jgi:hypothetical protein
MVTPTGDTTSGENTQMSFVIPDQVQNDDWLYRNFIPPHDIGKYWSRYYVESKLIAEE